MRNLSSDLKMEIGSIASAKDRVPFRVDVVKEEPAVTDTAWQKCWKICTSYFLPTQLDLKLYVGKALIVLFLYAVMYSIFGKAALPGGEVFALFVVTIISMLVGKLVGVTQLPPLVGMLVVGFTIRNVEAIPFLEQISRKTGAVFREAALSIILLRAGLELDKEALMKLKGAVLRLTVIPAMAECVSMGILGHYFLGLPFIFSFMLGFIISAIAPEVALPLLINLKNQGYGVKKGIIALLIGALSLDDILAITGFTICFSIGFSTSDLVWTIIRAPLEPMIGLSLSILFGVIFWYFPGEIKKRPYFTSYYNILMLWSAATAAIFFSEAVHAAGSGPLTCIALAFVAAMTWRQNEERFEHIEGAFVMLWLILEPILFVVIGGEITIDVLKDNAGPAILALVLSLVMRSVTTAMVVYGINLTWKEKLFCVIAFLPKASVQAAIGAKALDYARRTKAGEDLIRSGLTVLNVCVLSLILTAPLASILIKLLGPVLLTQDEPPKHVEELEEDEGEKRAKNPQPGDFMIKTDFKKAYVEQPPAK